MRRLALLTVIVAGIMGLAGVALAVRGSHPAARTGAVGLPLIAIHFEFRADERATHYTVVSTGEPGGSVDLDKAAYRWQLDPPDNDEECDNQGDLTGTGKEFVWRHGNVGDPVSDDGCNHDGNALGTTGHLGTVSVSAKDANWTCTARYTGTWRADGNASGDGPDGNCEVVPPPPPPSKAPKCDEQKAAAAAALAKELALEEAIANTREEIGKVAKQLVDTEFLLYDKLGASVIGSIGFSKALEDYVAAEKAYTDARALLSRLSTQLRAAKRVSDQASRALLACLKGKRLRLVLGPRIASTALLCGPQKIALAKAQASLLVYRSVARSFDRVGLAGARAKLLEAEQLVADVRSKLPSGPKFQKLARAVDEAAASLGRTAKAFGKLIAAVGRLEAKVKPAQRQAAKAQAALAACKR